MLTENCAEVNPPVSEGEVIVASKGRAQEASSPSSARTEESTSPWETPADRSLNCPAGLTERPGTLETVSTSLWGDTGVLG